MTSPGGKAVSSSLSRHLALILQHSAGKSNSPNGIQPPNNTLTQTNQDSPQQQEQQSITPVAFEAEQWINDSQQHASTQQQESSFDSSSNVQRYVAQRVTPPHHTSSFSPPTPQTNPHPPTRSSLLVISTTQAMDL